MKILIITGCLITAIAIAGCGSGSSPSSGSTSGSSQSTGSTAASTESGEAKSGESNGLAEAGKSNGLTETGEGEAGESSGPNETGEIPPSATPLSNPPTKIQIPTGLPKGKLAVSDLKKGTGATVETGDEVTVQYIGVGVKSKEKFDSSWERGKPISFKVGAGEVIKGWDQGLKGMEVGGRRELYVPPNLGYGSKGTSSIAPNEDIVFVIDLLSVKSGG